ncbi:transcriptional regulator family: Fungal Specific TF [Penicillium cataractarum]|uniref:Transcriptional regulator family: Fungal Specific TF n=1 Tax=Penicillium cataractarum TaxID=2100454 RepID=A0A9W9VTU4_9EURO|nr:transcriptional regulator family: Fungal Specific TF [Penicillium cataractarum]KAJ5389080.1 transcriptional regulator family: Fungal Specific TF [Penicillium cataractarum]
MASRKKQNNTTRKRDGIHFVNARPASETERLKAQKLVRAHVGRWISDQTKDRSAASEQSSISASRSSRTSIGAEHAGSSSFALVSCPPPLNAQRTLAVVGLGTSPPQQSPQRDWSRASFASQKSDSNDSTNTDGTNEVTNFADPVTIVPWNEVTRIEPQISGFLDPFLQSPSNFPPEVVNLCESYCITVLWPGLTPKSTSNEKKASELWFPLALSDPALFTAFMFGSLCHQRVQWLKGWVPDSNFGPKQQRILQLCEMESIKLISQAVQDPTRAVSDAVLLSVICMAHHQALEESPDQHRTTPFTPPFQRLQWLDVYGHLPPNMIHIHGLVELLKMRGGLKNIKLHGLRPTICFSDIMTASCFAIAPGMEFCAIVDSRSDLSVQELLGFGTYHIDHSFRWLEQLGLTYQIIEAMTAAATYVEIMKTCMKGSHDVSLLSDQRNLTQYTLLSVPPAAEIQTPFSQPIDEAAYESCRLAMLIFAVGVVFPIPVNNTPLPNLAKQLQAVLRRPGAADIYTSTKYCILLIWVLTLGGIAAFDSPAERAFFGSALIEVTRRTGLTSWTDVKRAMNVMLWYDIACDEAGETFFAEAQSLHVIE